MTRFDNFDKRCAFCTKTSPQSVLLSTNAMGYPDLDLRPPEMQRSTMSTWLQECPYCGYVAPDIENKLDVSADFLKSDEYMSCGGYEFKSKLSERFFKHYLISKAENNSRSQFFSLLHCAWACDDAFDELAVEIRKLTLKSIDKIDDIGDDEKNEFNLIKADLLRRSLQFDELINEFKDVSFEDENIDKIIAFQLELAEKKDSACYTLKDIPLQVTITVDANIRDKLDIIANRKGVSLIEAIESLLREKVEETNLFELKNGKFE